MLSRGKREDGEELLSKADSCEREKTLCMYGHTYSKRKDQPGKVANPARGQLNREN